MWLVLLLEIWLNKKKNAVQKKEALTGAHIEAEATNKQTK